MAIRPSTDLRLLDPAILLWRLFIAGRSVWLARPKSCQRQNDVDAGKDQVGAGMARSDPHAARFAPEQRCGNSELFRRAPGTLA
jgi:hypothetical protein